MLNTGRGKILAVALALLVWGRADDVLADAPLIMPVRAIDLGDVQQCYRDPHPGGFCDGCKSPNNGNNSLTNYVILREALKAGGMDIRVIGIASPNSARSRVMVETGLATIKADWDFNMDHNDRVLKSDAFIGPGELFKGIYGRVDNALLRNVRSLDDLRNLTATTNPNWRLDWLILQNINPAYVFSASTTTQMYHLIGEGRVDFTLLEFSPQPGMMRELDGQKLLPVPGVKMALPASQHFMVSTRDARASEIIAAVNRGLRVLRENGVLTQCLRQGGLINPATENWKVLNAAEAGISQNGILELHKDHR